MTDRLVRRGLAESLEDFAARIGSTPERARACWRLQGLRSLNALLPCCSAYGASWEHLMRHVGPDTSSRVAPGVAVPVHMPEGF